MAYTSVNKVKSYLGISGTNDDELIADFVAEAQKAIENATNRIFEVTADAIRYFTVGVDTKGRVLYLDRDLCEITSIVTNADASGGGTTLATTDYFTVPRNDIPYHAIKIAQSSSVFWEYTSDAEAGIKVTGKWGFSEVPPDDIAFCCKQWAAFLYKQKDAQVFDTIAQPELGIITIPQGLPLTTVKMLMPYVKRVFA